MPLCFSTSRSCEKISVQLMRSGPEDPKDYRWYLPNQKWRKSSPSFQAYRQSWRHFSIGSGLRLMECHRLRVKDIDFEQHQIIVRDGKGFKDRVTVLPESVIPELKNHLKKRGVSHIHVQFRVFFLFLEVMLYMISS